MRVKLGVGNRILLEKNMTRRDDGKTSLVDFLRSIKFAHHEKTVEENECPTHFAHFDQRARPVAKENSDDNEHIRSAN